MGIFGRKKKDDLTAPNAEAGAAAASGEGGTAGAETPATPTPKGASGAVKPVRDPVKAGKFFQHANSVNNHDYAIDCFINGLRHDPGNLREHEALREVSKRRFAGGGKPASFKEKVSNPGKDPIEKLLHAEKLLALDPLNKDLMIAMMERAVEADKAEPEHHLAEVGYWTGEMLLSGRDTIKRPGKDQWVHVAKLFAEMGNFDKAVNACKWALQEDNFDQDVIQRLKNYEAENTLARNKLTGQEGGYRVGIADVQQQQDLLIKDTIGKTDQQKDYLVERYRKELDESPQDIDRLRKLAEALKAKETDEADEEAIALFRAAWQQTGQYLYKSRIGDLRMAGFARKIRLLQNRLKAAPDDDAGKAELKELGRQRLEFELAEFDERVKNYPTDMKIRFELAQRLYRSGKFDEAIAAFQLSRSDPSKRAHSLFYLAMCYIQKGWLDEAIESFDKCIEIHPQDDPLGKEARYQLMATLERSAEKDGDATKARRAEQVGSQILQTDIKYKDILQRMEAIRSLIRKLEKGEAA